MNNYENKIPESLKKMGKIFEQNGFKSYLVGGAVRDMLMKKTPSDYDVTTNAMPEDVMRIFKKVIPTGIEHGTVTVHFMSEEIEVTTFRTESSYSDGRHPDSVSYAATINQDLSRRDFTINAIAISLTDFKIVDPFLGQNDIKNKIIKTVGLAKERFLEDGLRPIRAIRFKSQLNFSIEENTFSELFNPEILEKIKSISVERFRDEFLKIMKAEKPSDSLKIMEQTGILKIFIPELLEGRGCIQNDSRGYHIFDVLDHNFYACDGAPREKPLVRVAALFHDIGKPKAKTERFENGAKIINFYNHEIYSEQIAKKVLQNLKFSNAEIDFICNLIKNHMFNYESKCKNSAIRRFIVKVGSQNIDDLIDLRLVDMYGKYNEPVKKDSSACLKLLELKERISEILSENAALSLKDLKINGKDLMQNGIEQGPILGKILKELFDCVLEDPELNDYEKLLKIAKNLYDKYSILP